MDTFDLSTMEFWAKPPGERLEYFRFLRRDAPVTWNGPPAPGSDRGFWAIARYGDVQAISREPQIWSSAEGVGNFPRELFAVVGDSMDPTAMAVAAQSFMAMDDPQHRRLRGLVQKAFSVRQIARINDTIVNAARVAVDDLEAHETGDFIERVAKPLPLMTICQMMGVSESDRERIARLIDAVATFADPEFLKGNDPGTAIMEAFQGIFMFAYERASQARAHPDDGLMTALVEAEIDGERLTDADIAQFFFLVSVAANDTTRNTIALAMRALSCNPAQRALLMEDLPARLETGVEEFIRWATPVTNFMRTATTDAEIAGQPIGKGDKVMMLYSSANNDETVFEEPDRFDVTRSPNPHLSFGGGGPHHCLGAVLARAELKALFGELLRKFPDIEVEEPTYIVSGLMNAPGSMAMDTGRRAN